MDDPKPNSQLPEKYAHDPERYRLLESGAIYDNQAKRIVDNIGGPYAITSSEQGRQMIQRRKTKALISHMKGLAEGAGIELAPDADFEKIVQGASDGIQAITRHMTKTFVGSSNLRGMAEAWGKLTGPMLGTTDEETPDRDGLSTPRLYLLIAQLHDRRSEIVEGQVIEPGSDRGIKIVKGDE